jgi:hypothetical protein
MGVSGSSYGVVCSHTGYVGFGSFHDWVDHVDKTRKEVSEMARYIDADELYKATQKRIAEANEARMAVVDDEFLDLINDAFTEDVAPRAEVETWFRECEELQGRMIEIEKEIRKEIATEIFEELRRYIVNHCYLADDDVDAIWKHIDKLEKRYTDDDPPKGE